MHNQRRWLAVSAIGLSLFLSALDGTMVALALPPIARQFQLSARLVSAVTPSSYEMAEPPIIGREGNVEGWSPYVSNELEGKVSPYAAPARATDLRGLLLTYMMVGELDLFRDETIECAQRLMQASVPTELHGYPGAFHGFETVVPTAGISKRATAEYIAALRCTLHR